MCCRRRSRPYRRPRTDRGLTLVELLLVMALTGIIFALTQLVILRTIDTWWRVNSSHDSQQQLYRAQTSLERDLRASSFELEPDRATIAVAQAPPELATLSGADGDVLWFLSAIDPLTGNFVRKPDGTPFWQKNIVYYAVSPLGLDRLGYLGPGLAVGGYEVACPYKILIRKEIDSGPATTPGSPPSDAETLMSFSELSSHLNRPTEYSCAGMAAANSTVKPISANVLTFRSSLRPDLRGVSVDLRCTAIDRAHREGLVGNQDLSETPVTTQLKFTVFPTNLPPPP